MAVRVVEQLEAVGVDDGDGQDVAVAAGAAEFDGEAIIHIAAIEQAGERVVRRHLQKLLAAGDERQAQHRSGHHDDQARNLVAPTEHAVRIGRINRAVEVPVRRGEGDDSQIFSEGQRARGDADSLVVAQAGRADGEEVALKDNFAVYRRVRFVEIEEEGERSAHHADVEAAAGETEPRRIVFAIDEHEDDERKNKSSNGEGEADEGLLGAVREEKSVDQRDQEQDRSQTDADFSYQQFSGNGGIGQDRVGSRPRGGKEISDARIHTGITTVVAYRRLKRTQRSN